MKSKNEELGTSPFMLSSRMKSPGKKPCDVTVRQEEHRQSGKGSILISMRVVVEDLRLIVLTKA